MSQIRPLVDTLKLELRKQRITYKQVSEALELSETSIKRLFSEGSFSIKWLEKVCALIHLDISDLVHLMEKNIEFTTQLSLEQEKDLVSDTKLLLMALLLVNKLEFFFNLALCFLIKGLTKPAIGSNSFPYLAFELGRNPTFVAITTLSRLSLNTLPINFSEFP